jgi:hypothetical protein
MSVEAQVRVLQSELGKHRSVLLKIVAFYDEYVAKAADLADRSPEQAIVVSDILANYCTCAETLFLRISQFFENSLVLLRVRVRLGPARLSAQEVRSATPCPGVRPGPIQEFPRYHLAEGIGPSDHRTEPERRGWKMEDGRWMNS